MKILYWAESFWPYIGGVEILSMKLLPALIERGYEVSVITSHAELNLPDREEHLGLTVHRLPFRKALEEREPIAILKLRKEVRRLRDEFGADVAHLNFAGPSGHFYLGSAPSEQEPWVLAIRSPLPPRPTGESLISRLLRNANWVTANSKAVLADALQIEPTIVGRASVIYNGLDDDNVEPDPLPFKPPRLLCLGRTSPEKGFDVAIRAFATVLGSRPAARLTISGDGESRGELEALASELGIADSVEFTGWIAPHEVFHAINRSTMVLIPSQWEEPFCLVAVEAALMRRPVVAARSGGLVEVVAHDETGLIVPKSDSRAWAEAIEALLADPKRARRLGKRGRARAKEFFSLDRYVDDYDALYRKLVTEAS